MEDNKINYRYLFKVKDFMPLKRPNKKLIDNDGTLLPLICITTEVLEFVQIR